MLIVDDDPFIRKLIVTTLEDVSEFDLHEAARRRARPSGVAARAAAAARLPRHRHAAHGRHRGLPPDARATPAMAGATIVMLTATAEDSARVRARRGGRGLLPDQAVQPARPAAARRRAVGRARRGRRGSAGGPAQVGVGRLAIVASVRSARVRSSSGRTGSTTAAARWIACQALSAGSSTHASLSSQRSICISRSAAGSSAIGRGSADSASVRIQSSNAPFARMHQRISPGTTKLTSKTIGGTVAIGWREATVAGGRGGTGAPGHGARGARAVRSSP